MYSDFFLFAAMAVFFIGESILLSPHGSVVFFSGSLMRWKWKFSDDLPFFGGMHISLRDILPPLGTAMVSGFSPIALSSEGLVLNRSVYSAAKVSGGRYGYALDEISGIKVSGKNLYVNGEKFCSMYSEREACFWKNRISLLVETNVAGRQKIIENTVADMFDFEEADQRFLSRSRQTKSLRFMADVLFVYLFIISPVSVFIFSLEKTALYLAAGLGCLHCIMMYLFCRAYGKIFSGRKFKFPLGVLVSAAVFPPAMMRLHDWFFKDEFSFFSPLVPAVFLQKRESFLELASAAVRMLKYSKYDYSDDISVRVMPAYVNLVLRNTEIFLEKQSVKIDSLLIPPQPCDGSASYCPKCLCQFADGITVCSDCGIGLARF